MDTPRVVIVGGGGTGGPWPTTRYSAVECIAENRILRRIAPGSFEENGGLFVALTDEDMDYPPGFLAGCAACGIPGPELTRAPRRWPWSPG
jgi:glycerol-3-phosphate dehydrogenase